MARPKEFSFELTGAHAGKSMALGPYRFTHGKMTLVIDPDKLSGLINYFSYFNGWLVGSKELEEAKKRDAAAKGGSGGQSGDMDGSGADPGAVGADSTGAQGGASETGDAGTEANAEGMGATGDDSVSEGGLSDDGSVSLSPEALKISDAVKKLDVMNDEHWTQAGLPSVAAVAEISGLAAVTRKDIEAVAKEYTRDVALEKAI